MGFWGDIVLPGPRKVARLLGERSCGQDFREHGEHVFRKSTAYSDADSNDEALLPFVGAFSVFHKFAFCVINSKIS